MTDASTVDAGQGADQQQQQDQQQQDDKSVLGRDPSTGSGQQQQQPDPNAPAEWIGALPEDLRGDATLTRYKSVEDLARGHIEAHKVAKSKVVLPNAEDPESFARFAAAVRPEDATKYAIDLPDGQDPAFAEAMRPVFFEAGLLPQQVDALVKANNQFAAEAQRAADQKGRDELAAVQTEMGEEAFTRGKQAAVQMLNRLGIEPSFENDMARFVGAGNMFRTLFALAEKTGELGRVHADDVSLALGGLSGDKALDAARAMMRDPVTGPKLANPASPERKRYDDLLKAGSARPQQS
jgi:hypothetical protein